MFRRLVSCKNNIRHLLDDVKIVFEMTLAVRDVGREDITLDLIFELCGSNVVLSITYCSSIP